MIAVLVLAVRCADAMHIGAKHFLAIIGHGPSKPQVPGAQAALGPYLESVLGWFCLIGGFAYLEWMQPYYFTQDDALVGELPGILLGCRSYWQGVFPDWNPYVFMGAPWRPSAFGRSPIRRNCSPTPSRGMCWVTNSRPWRSSPRCTCLSAFVAMRHLGRQFGMGAVGRQLRGAVVCSRRLHFDHGPIVARLHRQCRLVAAVGHRHSAFREGPVGWKWILGVGMVLGLAYHAGFPQIAVILDMFFVTGIAVIACADRLPWRRVAPVVPALLFGVGLSAPLLIQHLQMTGSHERFVPRGGRHLRCAPCKRAALSRSWKPRCRPAGEASTSRKWGTFISSAACSLFSSPCKRSVFGCIFPSAVRGRAAGGYHAALSPC